MDGILYADTLRLQQHTELLLRERRTAQKLCERLRLARSYALSEEQWRYDRLIEQAETLVRYFQRMAEQVDDMSLQLCQLSSEIKILLEGTLL